MNIDTDRYDSEATDKIVIRDSEVLSKRAAVAIDDLKSRLDRAHACLAGALTMFGKQSIDLDRFTTDIGQRAKIEPKDGKYIVSVQEMGS